MNKHITKLLSASVVACLLPISAFSQSADKVSPSIEAVYQTLSKQEVVKKSLEDLKKDEDRALQELIVVTEIPSPPFKEEKRAEYSLKRFKELGLSNAYIDKEGNVIAVRKGSGNGPTLVIAAHIDSVFKEGTNVTVTKKGDEYFGAGVTDNARGVTTMFSMLKIMQDNKIKTKGDVIFVANVGEEGEGDLRGMKAFFRDNKNVDGFLAIDSSVEGGIVNTAVGSHRYEIIFKGTGGHSYGHFGQVLNPIHAMGRAIDKISDIQVPKDPKTTFFVTIVSGGTSVNAIPDVATMKVDMRSSDMKELLALEKQILDAIDKGVEEENKRWDTEVKLTVEKKMIGDRPAGSVTTDAPIVQAAVASLAQLGIEPKFASSSTDSNVPVSLGIPSITISKGGISKGAHSLKESYIHKNAYLAAQNALLLTLGLVGLDGVTEPVLTKK
ncbi:MAG: M20/M25/M40 family metallo-hydrolase [Campylobacteraceae bacterium]